MTRYSCRHEGTNTKFTTGVVVGVSGLFSRDLYLLETRCVVRLSEGGPLLTRRLVPSPPGVCVKGEFYDDVPSSTEFNDTKH